MPDLWKYTRAQSDTDAETFFAACVTAGTTLSAGQKTAIYSLVGGMKQMSLWSKMTALYPFVGGTAGTHAINLKSPGTYNITWTSVTHSSNGITGNGTSAYGDTGLNARSVLTNTSTHLSIYARTLTLESAYEIGAYSAPTDLIYIYGNYPSFYTGSGIANDTSYINNIIVKAGMIVASRTSSTAFSLLNAGLTKKNTTSISAATLPSLNIQILKRNGTAQFSSKNIAFSSIGSGLSDQDASNLSLLVQAYQTALGRAV